MDRQENGLFNLAELSVLAIVILATLSISYDGESTDEENLQLSEIKGTLNLVTRSSMDSIGLDEFKAGATASLDLESNPIFSESCVDCISNPTGVQIQGEVVITNLHPLDSGATIRLEGNLNVTHLREYSEESMITREWLMIDWDLDEFSSEWNIFVQHDPPKWSPDDRFHASFIETENSRNSRAGPAIIVESFANIILNVKGCMPNSVNCDGINREEINLTSYFVEPTEPILISDVANWEVNELDENISKDVSDLEDLRNKFNLESVTFSHQGWCDRSITTVNAANSWNVNGDSGTTIAPMNLWLQSIGLPSGSFTETDGFWTEIDHDIGSCGGFTNHDGKLLFGISIE